MGRQALHTWIRPIPVKMRPRSTTTFHHRALLVAKHLVAMLAHMISLEKTVNEITSVGALIVALLSLSCRLPVRLGISMLTIVG